MLHRYMKDLTLESGPVEDGVRAANVLKRDYGSLDEGNLYMVEPKTVAAGMVRGHSEHLVADSGL